MGRENPCRNRPYGTFQLNDDGTWLMPYEVLINPQSVESRALHWPWSDVKQHLDKLEALGKEYIGRRLYMVYNPMTTRFNGCTPSFFATITIRPPKIVDRPHRHTSAAINYYFEGEGRSTVEGKVYEWKAGDLMLSAPGWAVHNHASYDDYVYELTVQDQPLHLYGIADLAGDQNYRLLFWDPASASGPTAPQPQRRSRSRRRPDFQRSGQERQMARVPRLSEQEIPDAFRASSRISKPHSRKRQSAAALLPLSGDGRVHLWHGRRFSCE